MGDNKLLEMAAKAAGYVRMKYFDNVPYVSGEMNGDDFQAWNPLIDDKDAFRLAVKLHLPMDFYDANVDVEFQEVRIGYKSASGFRLFSAALSSDPYAATRRAITMAAAAIAEQQRQGGV